LTGNRDVQRTKKEARNEWKQKLQTTRGNGAAAAAALNRKTSQCEAALQRDSSQWTGESELLSAEEIIRPDARDARDQFDNNAAAWMLIAAEPFGNASANQSAIAVTANNLMRRRLSRDSTEQSAQKMSRVVLVCSKVQDVGCLNKL
jgi:hypothetical protein